MRCLGMDVSEQPFYNYEWRFRHIAGNRAQEGRQKAAKPRRPAYDERDSN